MSVRPLIGSSLLERLLVLKTLSPTQWATKVKTFEGICLKPLRSRVMPRNKSEEANMLIFRLTRCQLSPLDTQRRARGYPTIVNNIQPCPKLCLPMPLAHVGAKTDSTSYTATHKAWPISAHADWRSRQDMLYLRRGFSTLVLLVTSLLYGPLYIAHPFVYYYVSILFFPLFFTIPPPPPPPPPDTHAHTAKNNICKKLTHTFFRPLTTRTSDFTYLSPSPSLACNTDV